MRRRALAGARSTRAMNCGEATLRLLHAHGVTTVFGIPGVHTLEFYRGFGHGLRHVRARNELGADRPTVIVVRADDAWLA